MSFDIHLQDFLEESPDRSAQVLAVLEPYLDATRRRIITADGDSEVYGLDSMPVTGLMFTHLGGDAVWQLIFDTAIAGEWAIFSSSGMLCLTAGSQRATVPDTDWAGIELVTSGPELKAAVTGKGDGSGLRDLRSQDGHA